jgi:hypothetical protein
MPISIAPSAASSHTPFAAAAAVECCYGAGRRGTTWRHRVGTAGTEEGGHHDHEACKEEGEEEEEGDQDRQPPRPHVNVSIQGDEDEDDNFEAQDHADPSEKLHVAVTKSGLCSNPHDKCILENKCGKKTHAVHPEKTDKDQVPKLDVVRGADGDVQQDKTDPVVRKLRDEIRANGALQTTPLTLAQVHAGSVEGHRSGNELDDELELGAGGSGLVLIIPDIVVMAELVEVRFVVVIAVLKHKCGIFGIILDDNAAIVAFKSRTTVARAAIVNAL